MCVIIYIPKNITISEKELKDAWNTNPHGAGYSIQKNGKVEYKRGFMDFDKYYKTIKPLIGNYNLMLHFRISTSKSINKVQTHPYKKGNVMRTEGITTKPVICMNGVISGQQEYQDCNDTMSYIVDHKEAFSNINQDILNIIESATGAKWAVMMPNKTLLSSKFEEYEGRWYSNQNHLFTAYYYGYNYNRNRKKLKVDELIKNKRLLKNLRKQGELYEDLLDFVNFWCNTDSCKYCTKCLKNAKTLRDVKITLNENYYYGADDFYNYGENNENKIDYDNICALDTEATYYIDGMLMNEKEYLDYIDLLY